MPFDWDTFVRQAGWGGWGQFHFFRETDAESLKQAEDLANCFILGQKLTCSKNVLPVLAKLVRLLISAPDKEDFKCIIRKF